MAIHASTAVILDAAGHIIRDASNHAYRNRKTVPGQALA
jgi:hypothetical protein